MNLDRVTITGPDDRTDISELAALTREFPFVEWGILVSKSQEGGPRFPTRRWIEKLVGYPEMPCGLKLSLHVCGRWVRQLMLGTDEISALGVVMCFDRVQLNFHAEHHDFDLAYAAHALENLGKNGGPCEFIVQMDGTKNERMLGDLLGEGLDVSPLFDLSGGAGIVPEEWPSPSPMIRYHGYAGGLGPENLRDELERIGRAAGDRRIWIDMETRVRTDEVLDLEKVRRVLEICAPRVSR